MKRYDHLLCHIPNMLSNLRIGMVPFFVWQMLEGNTLNAAFILVASGITDMLDGYLARRFNWISEIGKALDPMADKLTTIAVCFCLMMRLPQFWIFFVIMMIKDSIMLFTGVYLHKKGHKFEGAQWYGKVATIVFYVVMAILIFFPDLTEGATAALVILAAGSALMAGLLYLRRAVADTVRSMKERRGQEQNI